MINHFKIFAHYRLLLGITTEAKRTTVLEGFREKRGLSGFADSAVNLELGKHEAVPGDLRE